MKNLISFVGVLLAGPLCFALVRGTEVDTDSIKQTLGLNSSRSFYFPEIPIGPRVALTCGHCAPDSSIFPAGIKLGAETTNDLYDKLEAGSYYLPFFQQASYPYDLALIIKDPHDSYRGPFVSVSRTKVKVNERLAMLGLNTRVPTSQSGCRDGITTNGFALGLFQVMGLYTQNVGFIVTGQNGSVTCPGDSGAYFFRILTDQSLELVGINSWGHADGDEDIRSDGKVVILKENLSGAGDLTSDGIRQWMMDVAQEKNLEICGINEECESFHSPFGVLP